MFAIDTSDFDDAIKDLKRLAETMPGVAVRAINSSMSETGKTDMPKIIRENYNFKLGAIQKRITITKATKTNLLGLIKSKGKPPSLTDFTGTTPTNKGVKLSVKKSTGRKLIPRAFIAPGKASGKMIVLRRPGNPKGQTEKLYNRYGPPGSGNAGSGSRIDVFYGPHPEIIYNTPENWQRIKIAAAERIDKNIAREIDAEIRREKGRW